MRITASETRHAGYRSRALEMQSQSSNVSAVFFLIRAEAALAASMVSSKPPFQ
jgi:hypothetical protein